MKSVGKRLVERTLVLAGVPRALRALRRRDILLLAYHNVVPDTHPVAGDSSLHLSFDRFSAQLDLILRCADVVPLASALDERVNAKRPRVAITFDDAYVGALRLAIPALARRGMPATVFAAPGLFGRVTWWDSLADGREVDPNVRDRALTEFAGNGETIIDSPAFAIRRSDAVSELLRIATHDELRAALSTPRITVGSHTWTHSNLAVLPSDAVARELRASKDWLQTQFPAAFVPWLSYPYGLAPPHVERAAAAAGYVAAVRVDGGWMTGAHRAHAHALPRFNVPAGLSDDGFRIRTGS